MTGESLTLVLLYLIDVTVGSSSVALIQCFGIEKSVGRNLCMFMSLSKTHFRGQVRDFVTRLKPSKTAFKKEKHTPILAGSS